MKLYLQGDVHGCDFWKQSYAAFKNDRTKDKRYVFLGDLVDTHHGLFQQNETYENLKIDNDNVVKNLDEIENVIINDPKVLYVYGNHELIRIGVHYANKHNYSSPWLHEFVSYKEIYPEYLDQYERIENRVLDFLTKIRNKAYLALQFDNIVLSHAGITNRHSSIYQINRNASIQYIEKNFDSIIRDFEEENKDPYIKDYLDNVVQVFGHYHIKDQDPKVPFPLIINQNPLCMCIDDEQTFLGKSSRWLVIPDTKNPEQYEDGKMKYDFSVLTNKLKSINFAKNKENSMFVSKDTLLSYFDWISDKSIIDKYVSSTLSTLGYLDSNGKITNKAIEGDILRYDNGVLLFGPCIVDWIVRQGMKDGWLNIENIESNEIYKKLDESFNLDQIVSNETLPDFAKIVNQLNLGIKVFKDTGLNRYAYIVNKLISSPHFIFCNNHNTYKHITLDMQLLYDIANDVNRTDINKEVEIIKNSKMNYNGLTSDKNLYDFAKLLKCWLSLPDTFRQKNGFIDIMPFLLKNRTKFEILYRGIKLNTDPIKNKGLNDEISFSLVSTSKEESFAKGYMYDSSEDIVAMLRFHNLYAFDLTEFDKFDIYKMAGGSEEVLIYGTFIIKAITEQNGIKYYDLVPKDQSEQELKDLMQSFRLKDNKISFSIKRK